MSEWRSVGLLVALLASSPLLLTGSSEGACGFVMVVMTLFWIFDLMPLAITSLLPMVLFPLLGILATEDTAAFYMSDSIMLFMAGLMMSMGMESSGLPRRMSLSVMLMFGTSPHTLTLGLMLTTGLLSMWISNTAAAAIMLPVIEAVVEALFDEPRADEREPLIGRAKQSKREDNEEKKGREAERNERARGVKAMLFMAVCFAANMGGLASPIGSPPNLVLMDALSTFGAQQPLTFPTWILFASPLVLFTILLLWLWLLVFFLGRDAFNFSLLRRDGVEQRMRLASLLRSQRDQLGSLSYNEKAMALLFALFLLLMLTRSPGFVTGWADLLVTTNAYGDLVSVMDSTPALIVAILMFVVSRRSKSELITWQMVHTKMPWAIVLLLGGGNALAKGAQSSCLSSLIGTQMQSLSAFSPLLISLLASVITMAMTQVVANTSTANIVLPVLMQVAMSLQVNPLYLLLPATFMSSAAFVLPVASPPNALVFGPSGLSMKQTIKLGVGAALLTLAIVTLAINTWGKMIFNLDVWPQWAHEGAHEQLGAQRDVCHLQ